jgi:hypothetical protein
MPSRSLIPVKVPAECGTRRVYRFRCCACGVVRDLSANTYTGRRRYEDIANKVLREGWQLGSNDDTDRCPIHAKKARKHLARPYFRGDEHAR